MRECRIVTNHGLVLAYISKYPRSTAREIASAIKISERVVYKIMADLEVAGYIERKRMGRSNFYRMNPEIWTRHETTSLALLRSLLELLPGDEGAQSAANLRAVIIK